MGRAEPLVAGVEALQFEFGVDTDSDGAVNPYLPSGTISDAIWDQRADATILIVRVHLLLRALTRDNSFSAGALRTYRMPAGDRVFDDDGFRRKRISTTIMMQNPWLTSQRVAL